MTQYNTNMSTSSYYAYCNAWFICSERSRTADEVKMDMWLANSAVRAGIVFG